MSRGNVLLEDKNSVEVNQLTWCDAGYLGYENFMISKKLTPAVLQTIYRLLYGQYNGVA